MINRFAVSTWLWTSPFTTETTKLFPKIKSMGFDAVEIPVEYPELIDGDKVAAALKATNLEAVVCGVFGQSRDLTHEDPAVHKNCFEYLRQVYFLCEKWNASFVAGPAYSAVGKARMIPPDQRKREWDLAVTNLREACKEAHDHGLMLALEPLNRFESDLVNNSDDVRRLVNEIDHPAAGILLDGFHMSIEEKDFEKAIATAGKNLIHVQVSENYRGTPGTGLTPWLAFKKGIVDSGYKGYISIESFTPEITELAGAVCIWRNLAANQDDFARDGLRFLRELFIPDR